MTTSQNKKRIKRQMRHVISRAFERFGVALSEEDVKNAEKSIQDGHGVKIEDQRYRTAYLLEVEGIKAVWIYDRDYKSIVTVMSINMYGEGKYKKFKKERKKRVAEFKKYRRRANSGKFKTWR
jgi:hypothetical protein